MKNFLSSEKRILEVQFFSSLAQVRHLWCCFCFRSGLIWEMWQWFLCVIVLRALTPASVHSLWFSPKFLNQHFLTVLCRLCSALWLVHLFPPHFSLPVIFTQTCLSTTLFEQSVLSTVTLSCQWYAQLSNQQFSPRLLCAFHFTWNKYRIYERLHFCVKLWHYKMQHYALEQWTYLSWLVMLEIMLWWFMICELKLD